MFLMKCKTKQMTPYVIFTINTPLPSPPMCLFFLFFFSFLRPLPTLDTRMAVVYIFFSSLFPSLHIRALSLFLLYLCVYVMSSLAFVPRFISFLFFPARCPVLLSRYHVGNGGAGCTECKNGFWILDSWILVESD